MLNLGEGINTQVDEHLLSCYFLSMWSFRRAHRLQVYRLGRPCRDPMFTCFETAWNSGKRSRQGRRQLSSYISMAGPSGHRLRTGNLPVCQYRVGQCEGQDVRVCYGKSLHKDSLSSDSSHIGHGGEAWQTLRQVTDNGVLTFTNLLGSHVASCREGHTYALTFLAHTECQSFTW